MFKLALSGNMPRNRVHSDSILDRGYFEAWNLCIGDASKSECRRYGIGNKF